MSEWKEYAINEIVEKICVGFVGPCQKYYCDYSKGVPMIRTTNLTEQGIAFTDLKYVTLEFHQKNKKSQLIKGDILVARHGDNGKACMYLSNKEANCLNAVILRPDIKKINPKFFLYQFNSPFYRATISSMSSGSVQDVINTKQIAKMLISLPDRKAQDEIAEVLSSLDDKIDLLHRQNKTLEQLAETLFRQWFEEEAEEDWEKDSLGNLFDIGIGRTPPRKEHHWFTTNPSDIKWVSIKDMGVSGIFIDTVSEYLTQEAVEQFNIPVIPQNTVMLSFKMTIGRLSISTENMLSNEAIAHFKQKEGSNLYPEFLYLYLKTFRWENLGSTSSIVEAINSQMIKDMVLVVPEEGKLKAFKELMKPYFDKIKVNQTQIRTLTQLRDTLLPKLMSGEVRVGGGRNE